MKDQVIVGCLAAVWLAAIIYFNAASFIELINTEKELPVK